MPDLSVPSTFGLPAKSRTHSAIAVCTVIVAFFLPVLLAYWLGWNSGPQFSDEQEYHLPTIELFAHQWPSIDFQNYPAAMTPGYHLLMAGMLKLGFGLAIIRIATVLITVALVGLLAYAASRVVDLLDAILICLPFAWSQYIFGSAISLAPHNLAWLGVLIILLICLRSQFRLSVYLALSLTLMLVVLARQIHLWLLAPIATAMVWPSQFEDKSAWRQISLSWIARQAAITAILAVPSLLVIAYFYRQWGGLAPTTQVWVRPSNGVNWSAIAMMFATFGFVGIWFTGQWIDSPKSAAWRVGIAGALLAFAVAAIAPTDYNKDAGRWTGLWNIARALPMIAGHSPIVIGLAMLGGFVVFGCIASLRWKEGAILGAALVGFIAAHAGINQAWGRYYEPMGLIILVLGCSERSRSTGQSSRPFKWLARGPLAMFAVLQLVAALMSVRP